MKYVALLSGGKDSCYNLLHCEKNGHKIIAAASLGPGTGKEELDSYLYQTVGQDAIEFVARALDVPLYRRVITGNAVEQGVEYGGRKDATGIEGDETEDLQVLLSTVKVLDAFPIFNWPLIFFSSLIILKSKACLLVLFTVLPHI